MEVTHNVVGWFQIPTSDFERAVKFYETVFDMKLKITENNTTKMAFFPDFPGTIGSSGCLYYIPGYTKPSPDGVLIFFTAFSGDVSVELSRVEAAGGKVTMPRTVISEEIGYMGIFTDTEGNSLAVHSRY